MMNVSFILKSFQVTFLSSFVALHNIMMMMMMMIRRGRVHEITPPAQKLLLELITHYGGRYMAPLQ